MRKAINNDNSKKVENKRAEMQKTELLKMLSYKNISIEVIRSSIPIVYT